MIITVLALGNGSMLAMQNDQPEKEANAVNSYANATAAMQRAINAVGALDAQGLDDYQKDNLGDLYEQLGEEINDLN